MPDARGADDRTGRGGMPRPTRRAFIRGVAGLGAALTLGGCGSGRWAGRFLTLATTSDVLGKAVVAAAGDSFARASGCRVHAVALPAADLVAALRRQRFTGLIEWDLVLLDAPRLVTLARALPRLFAPPGDLLALRDVAVPRPLRAVGVPLLTDTLAVASRLAPFDGRVPGDWAAVWDTTVFPGPRHFPADPIGLLTAAALADGVPPPALYPLDLDRAFAALDRLGPQITAWWTNPDRAVEALSVGAADLLLARGGEIRAALAGGAAARAPVAAPALPIALAALAGAPNGDVARDFFTHALLPATQGALRDAGYAPFLGDTEEGEQIPTVDLDLGWWVAQGGAALARFNAWRGMGSSRQ